MKPLAVLLLFTIAFHAAIGSTTTDVRASCAELPPLEVAVADTSLIVIGTVTEMVLVPPFDPAAPDTIEHKVDFVFAVDEYLKGSGPSTLVMREPGLTKAFGPDGTVYEGSGSNQFFADDSVGKRYVLFLPENIDSLLAPGCTWSRQLDRSGYYGTSDEQFIRDVRGILAATPTPPPTSSPTSTAVPPIGLPRSGGTSESGPTHVLAIATVGGVLALAGAAVARRYR